MIPSTLHFVHVSANLSSNVDFPVIVQHNIQDWQTMHPDWSIVRWSNKEVRETFPELLPLFHKIVGSKTRAWVSDLLRYAILYRFGGIYVDTDVVPIQPLTPLRKMLNFTVCEKTKQEEEEERYVNLPQRKKNMTRTISAQTEMSWEICALACNAVIGTTRNNPALQATLEMAITNTERELQSPKNKGRTYRIEYTGPTVWTQVAREHGIHILPTHTFYPCSWKNTKACIKENFLHTSYAMHKWSMTWVATEERKQFHPDD